MIFLISIAAFLLCILLHAILIRFEIVKSIQGFFQVGIPVGLVLCIISSIFLGFSDKALAVILVYAFLCELYIFIISSIGGSISASVLLQLIKRNQSPAEIESKFGGSAMVGRRLEKMTVLGLISRLDTTYSVTGKGVRLLQVYRLVRNFFWRMPLLALDEEKNNDSPDRSISVIKSEVSTRVVGEKFLLMISLALIPILLFWPHLSGQATFIGDSDRLNHFLSILKLLTDGYRDGLLLSWSEHLFGGFPLTPFTNPYPTSFIPLLWPAVDLFYAASVVSCGLMVAASWAAFAFLNALNVRPFASWVASALYILSAFSILKISQNDITYTAVVLIPIGLLVIRRIRRDNLIKCFVVLSLVLTYLFLYAFLLKVAYALILFSIYVLYRGFIEKDWRIPVVFISSFFTAFFVGLPRIYAVGEEFLSSARYTKDAYRNFDKLYGESGLGFHEALRWLDDRIFGRYYSEAGALGNSLNLHEGMLLYISSFAAVYMLFGLFLHGRTLLSQPKSRVNDSRYFLFIFIFCFLAITTKVGYFIVYLLLFKIEFIHTRIGIAALIPMVAMISLMLNEEFKKLPNDTNKKDVLWTWLFSFIIALILIIGIEHVANYYASSVFKLPLSNFFVLRGAVYRILLSALLTILIIWILRRKNINFTSRIICVYTLGFLMVIQAFVYAQSQISGEHMRHQWPPFKTPVRLLAGGDEFHAPSQNANDNLALALETSDYRTSIVCPENISGIFCSPHIAHFWKLRSLEGYLYAVPRRIAEIPWPAGSLSLRALQFSNSEQLPWKILALYNVKYAIELTPELMTNKVNLQPGEVRELSPTDIRILHNPYPVAPRIFYSETILAVPDLASASESLFPEKKVDGISDPTKTSYVEGLQKGASYSTEGKIRAKFGQDQIEIELEAQRGDRFLVVNERYDPRWKAFSGGEELKIYPTNLLMRGLLIPAGSSRISMKYMPITSSTAANGSYLLALLMLFISVTMLKKLEK